MNINRKGARRAWLASLAVGVALTSGLLAACGYQSVTPISAAYVGVCVDPNTGLRVPDALCGGADLYTGVALDHGGYLWDYYPPSYSGVVAGYGRPVVGVTIIHTVPRSTSTHVVVIDRGAAASGGSVTSVRTSAARSHTQVTEKATTSSSGTTSRKTSRTGSTRKATSAPTRNRSITRGGFGVPRRTR